MLRKIFALLLGCLMIAPAHAQSRTLAKVVIKVTLSNNMGQDFGLVIKKLDNESAISAIRVKTSADASVSVSLVPGDYVVESEKPLIVNGKSYEWSVKLKVESGTASLELNNETATITTADEALRRGRIVDETDLLKVLSDGVVNVQGELTQGTGSIVDSTGLILTSQHVIESSKELRVQFSGNKKVVAKLVTEDPDLDLDLAVLWVDLSACPYCKALASGSNTVVDGSGVFTISSPLAGIYTYSAETFAPDKCKQMSLKVVSQQNPATPQIRVVDPRMVQQVWSDFEPYRQK
jgi:S1-C subfamily serine protease